MLKVILGVVVGIVVAIATVIGGELLVHALTGGPVVDMNDKAALEAMMASTPIGSKIGVVATYFVAVLLGGLAAARISGRAWTAWIVAAVLLAATGANYVMLPHPMWMIASSFALIVLSGWLSGRFGIRRSAA
ncbi:MAG: hypothetical protein SGJ21_05310 [Alphaproteobacteria bacterium]|nr:hypothetical protein [Alphaproteobacteria bacterium]